MDEILTPTQVAQRLQVKPSWVYEQTRERAEVRNPDPLPHIKMGRYLRFNSSLKNSVLLVLDSEF